LVERLIGSRRRAVVSYRVEILRETLGQVHRLVRLLSSTWHLKSVLPVLPRACASNIFLRGVCAILFEFAIQAYRNVGSLDAVVS